MMNSNFFTAKSSALSWMYLLWLVSSALLSWWFVWVVVTGIFGFQSDPSGHFIFASTGAGKTFYPFTLGVTALSFFGVTYYVYRAERGRWWSLPLSALVGLVSTIGMVNLYEQVFINFADLAWRANWWWFYYGRSIDSFVWTLVGVSWVFAALPWWLKSNRRTAEHFFLTYLATMLVWLLFGMPGVETRSILAYVLNTLSRFFSQATLIVLVAKPLPLVEILRKIHLA